MAGAAWDSVQPPARVSYAPMLESIDVLLALPPPPALGSWFDDSDPAVGTLWRSPRATAVEQLAALVAAEPTSSSGLPYDSYMPPAHVAYSPRHESVDVLLALVPGEPPLATFTWGQHLDNPPAISRYTIITPAQEDAAEQGALPLVPPAPFGEWFVSSAMRSRYRRAVAYQEDAVLHADPFAIFFEGGPGRVEVGHYRLRTVYLNAMLTPKDPNSVESFERDCARLLQTHAGGTIATITTSFFEEGDGACVVVSGPAISADGLRWSVTLSGCTDSVTYRFTARILTTSGEVLDSSISFVGANAIH